MAENAGILGKSEQCLNTALTLNDLTGGHRLPDQDSSTRLIPLTQGQFAIVDATDYDWLNQWKWCAYKSHRCIWYATSARIPMHRLIMAAPAGVLVDHRDGNGLNNRRANLRLCDHSQNAFNAKLSKRNKSGYSGVTWARRQKRWRACARVRGQYFHLGYFIDKESARAAVEEFRRIHHGEFYAQR